jgi:hypothetical protein
MALFLIWSGIERALVALSSSLDLSAKNLLYSHLALKLLPHCTLELV